MILAMILAIRSRISRAEGPQKNARLVGPEDRSGACDVDGHELLQAEQQVTTLDGDRLLEARHHVLRQSHFRQREQERQRGLRALVPIDAIHMQSIAAAAGLRRVELQAEIVPADEPVEGALGLFVPPEVRCGAIGFQAGGDRRLRFDGLLVEIGARAAAAIEAVAADRAEVALLGRSAILSASAEPAGPARTPPAARLRVRSESARGRASRCRTTVRLQTSASPAWRSHRRAPSAGTSASRESG